METERRVLARMLRQTAHYLDGVWKRCQPEKDVQDALLPTLGLAFQSVIREIPGRRLKRTADFGIQVHRGSSGDKFVEKQVEEQS
jgi:hypothetical protein